MSKRIVRPGRTVTDNVKKPIDVRDLQVGMHVIELDRPWLETPFILQGFTIDNEDQIAEIQEHCEFVYIEDAENRWIHVQTRTVTRGLKKGSVKYENTATNKEEFARAKSAYSDARNLTREFMDDVRLGKGIDIQTVERTVSECVQSILRNPDAMLWMSKIRNKDEYTAEHSLNVGLLAISFGRHLGVSEDDLNKLGVAGMLHDVGKMRTPLEVLNKEGQLNEQEFHIIKAHATHGRDILMSQSKVHHSAIDVAFGHHEALDGTGYPRKIKASGITEITRIITLCDVFDAITSDRVYKNGQSSLSAMKILHKNRKTKFDDGLVTQFIDCIGLYPPGSIVELRHGEVGIVISTNFGNRHLPKVLVLRDQQKMPTDEKIYDLAKFANKGDMANLIRTVLPNGSFGIRIEDYIERGLTII